MDEESTVFDSNASADNKIAQLKKRFEGKTLKQENRAVLNLGLKFAGVGDSQFVADRRFATLQPELEKLGYRISAGRNIDTPKMFKDRAAAEQYLADTGTGKDGLEFHEQEQLSYEAIFPIDPKTDLKSDEDLRKIAFQSSLFGSPEDKDISQLKATLRQVVAGEQRASLIGHLQVNPGATVKRIGPRRWHIDQPARFTARAVQRTATVMKVAADSNGFEMLRTKGTSGVNYEIGNEAIIKQLEKWDTRYGVTVLDADYRSFTVRFKNLPEDLSLLCSEMFLFCPVVELSEDENTNAASLRRMAAKLRQTNTASFGWH